MDTVLDRLVATADGLQWRSWGGASYGCRSMRASMPTPTDELAHLTDRFYRGGDPNTRPTRGLGLGLALVHEILSLHDTELEVVSEPGRGSRFSFRLPDVGSEVSAAT